MTALFGHALRQTTGRVASLLKLEGLGFDRQTTELHICATLFNRLRSVCNLFTPKECETYFRASGYASE